MCRPFDIVLDERRITTKRKQEGQKKREGTFLVLRSLLISGTTVRGLYDSLHFCIPRGGENTHAHVSHFFLPQHDLKKKHGTRTGKNNKQCVNLHACRHMRTPTVEHTDATFSGPHVRTCISCGAPHLYICCQHQSLLDIPFAGAEISQTLLLIRLQEFQLLWQLGQELLQVTPTARNTHPRHEKEEKIHPPITHGPHNRETGAMPPWKKQRKYTSAVCVCVCE